MQRYSFLAGLGLGLLAPLIAIVLTQFTMLPASIGLRPLGFYVIAALINLLLVRHFYRRGPEQVARGVILCTFVLAMLLIFINKSSLI